MIRNDDTFIDLTEIINMHDKKNTCKYKFRHIINFITFNIFYKKYR